MMTPAERLVVYTLTAAIIFVAASPALWSLI